MRVRLLLGICEFVYLYVRVRVGKNQVKRVHVDVHMCVFQRKRMCLCKQVCVQLLLHCACFCGRMNAFTCGVVFLCVCVCVQACTRAKVQWLCAVPACK